MPQALRCFHTQVKERAPRLVSRVPALGQAQMPDLRYLRIDGVLWRSAARVLTGSETITGTNSTANLTVVVIEILLAPTK